MAATLERQHGGGGRRAGRAAAGGPGPSEPAGALEAIIAALVRFRGTARQSDDNTTMLVSREGAA